MRRIIILGAGGHAREIADVCMACNASGEDYHILGFIDEDRSNHGRLLNNFPILGDFSWFDSVDKSELFVIAGIGDPALRRKIIVKALDKGLRFCNIVHPTAVVTPFVHLGKGVVIAAGCIFTNQIQVGEHVYFNLDTTVSHDAIVGDFCNINPGVRISGNVHIKQGCYIGTGVAIIQGVTIGEWSILGAGAVVVADLPANVTAVGVPAKVIKTREAGWHE